MKTKLGILVLLVALVGCGKESEGQKKKEEQGKGVKTVKVSPTKVVRNNVSSGIVEPLLEKVEITETGGTVIEVNFKNGDIVTKGDLIIKLEDISTETKFMQADASYIFAQSDFEIKELNYEKMTKLYKNKLISEEDYLTAKNSYAQSLSNLKNSEAQYKSAKDDFEGLTVEAEIDGVVTNLDAKIYDKLKANDEVLTVIDNSVMLVKSMVSVLEVDGIQRGNTAKVKLEGLQNEFVGKVVEINPSADPVSKKYQVKLELENDNGKIKNGMYGNVIVESGEREGYLVPKDSILIKELDSYIFIVKDGVARSIKIERGYSKEDMQEVISEELYPEMDLVVEGQYLLEDKDKVKVLN